MTKKKIYWMVLPLIFIILLVVIYQFAWNNTKKTVEIFDISNSKQFIRESPTEAVDNLLNEKEGIYYFGFDRCPWCQELLPIFETVLKGKGQTSYAVDTKSKEFTDTAKYRLKQFYSRYQKGEFTVPFIVIISKSKRVWTHIGTLRGHDATVSKLTAEQKKRLINSLNNLLSNIQK